MSKLRQLAHCRVCGSVIYPGEKSCRYCQFDQMVELTQRDIQRDEADAQLGREIDQMIDEEEPRRPNPF